MLGVGMLGIGYAVVQNLIWSSVPLATPPALLNLSAGLIGCAVNVLLSLTLTLTPTLAPTLALSLSLSLSLSLALTLSLTLP